MTTLPPIARALFEAANEAASKDFDTPDKTKKTALHEWLCAEVKFADAVGIGFVLAPKEEPQEDWLCQAFQQIAAVLCQMRHYQFGDQIQAIT